MPHKHPSQMTAEDHARVEAAIRSQVLHDIPGMTVTEHHCLSIGLLAVCYQYVPSELKRSIEQACNGAAQMGMEIDPSRLRASSVNN
jgi:hypothetical protein